MLAVTGNYFFEVAGRSIMVVTRRRYKGYVSGSYLDRSHVVSPTYFILARLAETL